MDISKITRFLPEAELSELRPCTAPGKIQFHLLVARRKDMATKIINVLKLADILSESRKFSEVKSSAELGVVKAVYSGAEISALASGRVVVKKCADERKAQELLEELAPMLKKALF